MLAGRYRLDTRIGAGGMGEVWRGEDTVLARTVAVKVLLPGRTDDPGFLVRFQGEARAMATVNHPGVVDVYDYGVHEVPGAGATAYLVMKFVDGEPLDRLLGRLGNIAPAPAMDLIAQAASALQAVHDQGIVHRDVKPGNLMVRSDGTLVLTDFGIARSDAASRLTDAGMVLGTAAYCAPEQAEGAPVTPAVDIYALGVVAYECLAGQRPFDGDTPVTIALKHIREAPPPLPPHIPAEVRALVERALSKDPARRFPNGAAMSTAARQAALGRHADDAAASPAFPLPGGERADPRDAFPTGASRRTGLLPGTPSHGPPTEAGAGTATGGRGRRAARRPRRRGRVLAVSAVAGVMCAGLVTAAINGMAASTERTVDVGVERQRFSTPGQSSRPPRTATRPPRHVRVTPTPQIPDRTATPLPDRPKPSATPDVTPTTAPTGEPSPSGSPSPTATPTVTPVAKRKVPDVMYMSPEAAKETLRKAGLKAMISYSADADPTQCSKVVLQRPAGGTMWDPRRPVEVTVVNDKCPPSSTPSPAP
ncbi:hypothetical protein GCM10017673_55450 [Streptosporangium violaceochromogenes]|nr:hypothetical protein GCM10017673_55450 [Streptosporangium violaceochromogenes]